MSSPQNSGAHELEMPFERSDTFAPLGARRLLLLGGIGLILVGMIFGDIFAVFVLHQNAARVGASLSEASHAALAGDGAGVLKNFQDVGGSLENRGTKVDTHVHIVAFGYLALMLALLEPWIALSRKAKKHLTWLFLFGAGLLPVCVFLIHYVGLTYSPVQTIGWASIFADLGGFFVVVAMLGYLTGLVKHFLSGRRSPCRFKCPGAVAACWRSIPGAAGILSRQLLRR
jgi:hypothetical protein